MIDHTLVRRYIAATHALAAQADEVDRVQEQLGRLQQAAKTEPLFLPMLRHPDISLDDKRAVLLRVAGAQPSRVVAGLLDLLLEKERTEVLLAAADAFTQVADEAKGVVRAHVEVAHEPTEAQKQRLETALSRLAGAPVVTEYLTAPEVIGGARLRIAGRLIDGSLAGHIDGMVEQVGSMTAGGDRP